jgi:hypothetical protein
MIFNFQLDKTKRFVRFHKFVKFIMINFQYIFKKWENFVRIKIILKLNKLEISFFQNILFFKRFRFINTLLRIIQIMGCNSFKDMVILKWQCHIICKTYGNFMIVFIQIINQFMIVFHCVIWYYLTVQNNI